MTSIFGTAALALFGWSVQRIIRRIDGIAAQLEVMGNRVTAIETKQNAGVKIARKTASKVGVRLPRELTDTVDPSRIRTARS
jgi:hypothetical protein